MEIKHAALIGLGAIGTVYGKRLHDTCGARFAVIAGGARGERLKTRGAALDGETFFPRVLAPGETGFPADLILFSVKNYQLEQAIADVRALVGPRTVLLTLLNGVTARDRIRAAYPENKTLYGLSIGIDAIRTEKQVVHTQDGVIQFGEADNTVPSPEVRAADEYLRAAGIRTEVCPDMIRAMWKKWMLNVGCNQVTALTGATFRYLSGVKENRLLFREAMREVVALAKASGVNLTERDAEEFVEMMDTFSPDGKTSMLQDIEAKRPTEVENFSGTVVKLGEKLHVPTPVNHVLYCLIRAKEQILAARA